MTVEMSYFVIVFKDEAVLVEAYDVDEALGIIDDEFKELDMDRERFTVLPITKAFLEEKDEDDDKKSTPF